MTTVLTLPPVLCWLQLVYKDLNKMDDHKDFQVVKLMKDGICMDVKTKRLKENPARRRC